MESQVSEAELFVWVISRLIFHLFSSALHSTCDQTLFQTLSFLKMKDEEWIEILPIHLIIFISQMLLSKIVTEINH